MADNMKLEQRIASLETRLKSVQLANSGLSKLDLAAFSAGDCTNTCTDACTRGCTNGCTGGGCLTEVEQFGEQVQ